MKRKIIIDTDPGQDDALAILLALASPEELDVLGIVTVAGNVPLPLTTRNARALVELANRPEVPVFAGCPRPLMRNLVTAEHVHGKTGLDGWDMPEPSVALQREHGVDWLIETLRQAEDDSITLCTLAPLTNVGMAFAKLPIFSRKSERLSRWEEVILLAVMSPLQQNSTSMWIHMLPRQSFPVVVH